MNRGVAVVGCIVLLVVSLGLGHRLIYGHDHADAGPRVRAQLGNLSAQLAVYRADHGAFPHVLEQLASAGASMSGPYAKPRELVDPWGEKFYYRPDTRGTGFVLFTLGGDRSLGGWGNDRDHQVESQKDEG